MISYLKQEGLVWGIDWNAVVYRYLVADHELLTEGDYARCIQDNRDSQGPAVRLALPIRLVFLHERSVVRKSLGA